MRFNVDIHYSIGDNLMHYIDPDLLDAETVNTFLEMGVEVISSLVDLYVENSSGEIDRLTQLIQQGDLDNIRKTAHSLKGASFNTGASAMGQLCLEIEKHAKDNDLTGMRPLIAQLGTLLEKTQQAFRQTYE